MGEAAQYVPSCAGQLMEGGTSDSCATQLALRTADPSQMKTSIQVMFLVIVGVVSTVYAFYLEVRRGAENDRFLEWLKTERKPDWDALSRVDRFLPIRADEMLRRGPLADDEEFHARYRLTRHGTRFVIAMIIAGTAIAVLILGIVFLDWDF
jgi:hypothetical protein